MEEDPKDYARQRLEARLERGNNTLDNHWGAIKGVHINQPLSDYHYKRHVSRLMHTYTRPSGEVDHHLQPISRVMKPVTQLYGVNGLRSSRNNDTALLQQKEAGWEGRLDIYEKIDELSRKKFAMAESSFLPNTHKTHDHESSARMHSQHRHASPGTDKRTTSSNRSPHGRSHSPIKGRDRDRDSDRDKGTGKSYRTGVEHRESGGHRHSHSHGHPVKKPSRRADFDGISENDLIANGLYTLTTQQLTTFNQFSEMISSFDNTDMIHILEDALEAAKNKTGLDDYGGFADK